MIVTTIINLNNYSKNYSNNKFVIFDQNLKLMANIIINKISEKNKQHVICFFEKQIENMSSDYIVKKNEIKYLHTMIYKHFHHLHINASCFIDLDINLSRNDLCNLDILSIVADYICELADQILQFYNKFNDKDFFEKKTFNDDMQEIREISIYNKNIILIFFKQELTKYNKHQGQMRRIQYKQLYRRLVLEFHPDKICRDNLLKLNANFEDLERITVIIAIASFIFILATEIKDFFANKNNDHIDFFDKECNSSSNNTTFKFNKHKYDSTHKFEKDKDIFESKYDFDDGFINSFENGISNNINTDGKIYDCGYDSDYNDDAIQAGYDYRHRTGRNPRHKTTYGSSYGFSNEYTDDGFDDFCL